MISAQTLCVCREGNRYALFRFMLYSDGTAQGGVPSSNKNPGIAAGVLHSLECLELPDQKSMPPMPPPGGMAGPAEAFFGTSATIASVVISSAATEAAFWIAVRTTLVGSMMPFLTRSTYSPV